MQLSAFFSFPLQGNEKEVCKVCKVIMYTNKVITMSLCVHMHTHTFVRVPACARARPNRDDLDKTNLKQHAPPRICTATPFQYLIGELLHYSHSVDRSPAPDLLLSPLLHLGFNSCLPSSPRLGCVLSRDMS